MCGLIAGSGKTDHNIIRALGCLNSKRGMDSAGIGWWDEGKLKVHKIAKNPNAAFNMDLSDSIRQSARAGIAIGHTRQATTGEITSENAHPFLMDGVLFAHNGIIRNHAQFGEYKVDSQSLIHGIKKKNFSEYEGSIALVWIEGGKLHAFRHGNPLYRGLKNGALYLTSEESFLKEVGCEKIREIADGHIYTIAGGGIIKSIRAQTNSPAVVHYPLAAAYDNDGQNWGGFRDADKDTPIIAKPRTKEICTCGHNGREHNRTHHKTGEWQCFATMKGDFRTCPCNAFVDKRKKKEVAPQAQGELPMVELKPEPSLVPAGLVPVRGSIATVFRSPSFNCCCGHDRRIHSYKGDRQTCQVYNCQCADFKLDQTQRPLLPIGNDIIIPPKRTDWAADGLDPKEECDCRHELEYHTLQNYGCSVRECNCTNFFPLWDSKAVGNEIGS